MTVVAALLAGGGGTRFQGPTHKLRASLGGRELLERSLANVMSAAIGPVVVVTGALRPILPPAVIARHNDAWESGQASSIRVAIAAAEDLGAEFVVIGLADQPDIAPVAWRAVADAAHEHLVVVASYDGRRGPHPVRLHRSLWPMLPTRGDDGAKSLLRDHPALVHEVACEGSAHDIDTLEDLGQWKSS